MLGGLRALDPADWRENLPAYLTMVALPFCYSISEGLTVGTISYVAVHLFTGAGSRKIGTLAGIFLHLYFSHKNFQPACPTHRPKVITTTR